MDFGGGVFEVKSTSGDTQLGGTDMDKDLTDNVVEEFKKDTGIDLTQDKTAIQRVREAVEKSKIELSTTLTTDINLPFISADASGPKHLTKNFTRAKLEELVRPIVEKCKGSLQQAIKDAKLTPNDIDRIILVGGPTRMPIVRKFVEDFVGKAPERGVDPMECVALGAAIQGGVLAGDVKDILLLDVTPLSLGVETLGGVMTKLIERNTTIPTRKSQVFTTAADYQTTVTVHVLQGERTMSADNVSLGMFNLEGIPPAARGVPQIEVTYDIDANGILNVSAKDTATNKEQKITISASTKLSDDEKERLIKDAEKYAGEDKKKKEEVEIQNSTESMIYTAEKTKTDLKDKISKEQEEKLDKGIADAKEVLKSKDIEKMKISSEELGKILQEISAQAYQQASAAQQADSQKQAEGKAGEKEDKKEKVVDADYKVVDEDEDKKSSTDEPQ
jgi:molecular chaperone DnaK